ITETSDFSIEAFSYFLVIAHRLNHEYLVLEPDSFFNFSRSKSTFPNHLFMIRMFIDPFLNDVVVIAETRLLVFLKLNADGVKPFAQLSCFVHRHGIAVHKPHTVTQQQASSLGL